MKDKLKFGQDDQYAILFEGCSANRSVEGSRASVSRIDQIFRYYRFLGDPTGQAMCFTVASQAMLMSESQGRTQQMNIFREWILSKVQPEETTKEQL